MSEARPRVLIVDDSPTARAAIRAAIEADVAVVGEASDGATASQLVRELAPDLVTMDVFMRGESGIDVAASIMRTRATPIVIVTASDPREPSLLFKAMQAGVLEVCAKLPAPSHPDYLERRARLVRTLKVLSRVPVIHRTRRREDAEPRGTLPPRATPNSMRAPARVVLAARPASIPAGAEGCAVLLLGASTGGPPVVAQLLRALPSPLPIAVALVQHMTPGFMAGFSTWLEGECGHRVALVKSRERMVAGTVYLPQDDRHLLLARDDLVTASDAPPRQFHRPSIDHLFESAVQSGHASRATAVLLTGMGRDGAQGLCALRAAGARTFAQAPATCAVPSMPKHAIELGAVEQVLEPDALSGAVARCWASPSG